MLKPHRIWLLFPFVCVVSVVGNAQTPSTADAKQDYSQEPYVIEEHTTEVAYENDGNSARRMTSRIRIQSDAGLQAFVVLSFPYQKSTESFEIDFVRVQKGDDTMVSTLPDSAQDMEAEVTRRAPLYSALRERQVAVRGLGVGDVIEYQVRWKESVPLAPGEFWGTFSFANAGIVLRETVRVSVPRGRPVKSKSPDVTPAINNTDGRQTFTWTGSRLNAKPPEEEKVDLQKKVNELVRGRVVLGGIQISSFANWEAVGR